MRAIVSGLLLWLAVAGSPAAAATAGLSPALADPRGDVERPIVGTFRDRAVWGAYKARFVSDAGRVVDTANGGISHSEGQGYGMLLAVAADDREAFDRIWGWTRANLMVRDDALFAWRWDPAARPGVADTNNATDGDVLISWALTEAADAWDDVAYAIAARRTAVEVGRKLIISGNPHGSLMLPGYSGFSSEDRADGPVVNLSYLVFPAFARLPRVAPEFDWSKLAEDGRRLVDQARFGAKRLPIEWTALGGAAPTPAAALPPVFGYNAVRIPLYLAWAGLTSDLPPLDTIATGDATLAVVDVVQNRIVSTSREPGYRAIAALGRCAASQTRWPSGLRTPQMSDNYYSVTIHMLALAAAQTRFPSCLQ